MYRTLGSFRCCFWQSGASNIQWSVDEEHISQLTLLCCPADDLDQVCSSWSRSSAGQGELENVQDHDGDPCLKV